MNTSWSAGCPICSPMPPFVPGWPQVKLMKAPIGECWALNPMGQDRRFDIIPSVRLVLASRGERLDALREGLAPFRQLVGDRPGLLGRQRIQEQEGGGGEERQTRMNAA